MAPTDREPEEAQVEERESFLSVIGSLGFLILLVFAFKSSVLDANNIPSGSMIPTLKIGDYLFVNKMRYSLRIPFTNTELFRYDDPRRGDIVTFIPPDPGKHYVKRVMGMPGDRIRITNVAGCRLGEFSGTEKHTAIPADYDFPCGSVYEPQIAFVEYREKDRGPWKNYGARMLPARLARSELLDADNQRVLPPDVHPPQSTDARMPVLLEETSNGKKHYIVETAYPDYGDYRFACDDIKTTGCVVPADQYLVMGDNRDDSRDSRFIGYVGRDKIQGKAMIIYFSINWHDIICQAYIRSMDSEAVRRGHGFRLEAFPPAKQARYCSPLDEGQEQESIRVYLERTLRYRIFRMQVRWGRLLRLLN